MLPLATDAGQLPVKVPSGVQLPVKVLSGVPLNWKSSPANVPMKSSMSPALLSHAALIDSGIWGSDMWPTDRVPCCPVLTATTHESDINSAMAYE